MEKRSAALLFAGTIILYSLYFIWDNGSLFFPLNLTSIYFSKALFIAVNSLAIISAVILFFAYVNYRKKNPVKKQKKKGGVNYYLIITIAAIFILIGFSNPGHAVIITMAGLIVFGLISKKLKSKQFYAVAFIFIILISACAYFFVISAIKSGWPGTDEVAFNYYAAYLFLHGVNPYTTSMQPILKEYNISATHTLDGLGVYKYDYPSLSFLMLSFMPLIGQYQPLVLEAMLVLLIVFVSFFLYHKSNYDKVALIPIMAFIFVQYSIIGAASQFIAVSVFLLLAYTERKNTILSGIFIGLSISINQLSWFAIPFFLVLALREKGLKDLITLLAISVVVFLLFNGYFIMLAPRSFFNDILSVFSSPALIPAGPNIALVLIRVYPVAFWCISAIAILVLAAMLILFYLYTSTLRPLLALVPAFIFFLAWRNLTFYAIPYIAILIVICCSAESGPADLFKSKIPIIAILLSLIIIISVVLVYAHAIYLKENTLSISSITLGQPLSNITSSNSIQPVILNVTNNGNSVENVSILIINKIPPTYTFVLSPSLKGIPPHVTQSYGLNLSFVPVANTTNKSVYAIVFSKNYIVSSSTSPGIK
jgi:uncharacterized membrane protein